MKRIVLPLLLVLDLLLLAAIAAAWSAGDAAWRAPAAHLPDPGSLAPERVDIRPPAPAALAEMLERPLFDRDRKPPEVAVEGEEASEGPGDMVLLGIFVAGAAEKGVVVRADGVVHRVHLGESLGPWRLEALDGRGATFIRGDERRELALTHLPQPQAPPSAASKPPPPVRPAAPQPATRPGVVPQAQRSTDRRQRRGPDQQ